MAFCETCGFELPDAAASCPRCGQARATGAGVTLVYADFWSRFAAWFLDVLILVIPSILFAVSLPFIGSVAVEFLYHWLLVAYWDGQSVGKRVVGIRVTRPDGTPVDSAYAARRAAMRIVSGLPLGLGFLWAAWDPEKRTWHDMVADTRVFRVRGGPLAP